MANTIVLNEPTVDYLISTGWTGLRLERGVSSTNLGSFALVVEIPYVAGQTRYTYIDTTGATTDWYRVVRYAPGAVYGTYSPPWPVTPPTATTGDGARRSLKNCRRTLARKLGSLQVVITTADGNDAGTTFISRALANQIDPNRLRGHWAMPSDGVSRGQVRSIGENALNAQSGQVSVADAFLSKIVSGTQIEFHKLLPPDEAEGMPIGLKQCLNLALAECWTFDRLAVTATGAVTLDLAASRDWLDPGAVYELYGPTVAGALPSPWGPYVVRGDAAVVALDVVGLAAGASVAIDVTRPGDTYMKVDGTWTDNQLGFVNDDDECLFQPAWITEIALAHAYLAIANNVTGATQVRYERLAEDQRRRANVMKLQLQRDREAPRGVGDDWTALGATGRATKDYWA